MEYGPKWRSDLKKFYQEKDEAERDNYLVTNKNGGPVFEDDEPKKEDFPMIIWQIAGIQAGVVQCRFWARLKVVTCD